MWKNTCKLLLFDLDGTLLQSDKTISKRTLSVLKQCREKGILIGVSTSRSEQNSLVYLNELMPDILISSGGALPILVIAEYIKKRKREYYHEKYPELIVIDITNLLFAVRSNDELKNQLIVCLNYSTENIEPAKGFIEINSLQHNSYTQSLIREAVKGRKSRQRYECAGTGKCHLSDSRGWTGRYSKAET